MKPEEQKKYEFYLNKLNDLPTLPGIVGQLIKLIDNPMTSLNKIEDLLGKDPSLTLKVLRLANSAYYAIPGGAKTIRRAITYLGYDTLKQLVISSSIFDIFDLKETKPFKPADFWKHSVGAAIACETIGKRSTQISDSEVFVCGLVHDMGKLALKMIDSDSFDAVCAHAREKNLTTCEAEKELEAPQHCFWGFALAKKWDLPSLIQDSIQYHHSPNPKTRGIHIDENNTAVDIVFLANQAIHKMGFGDSGYSKIPDIHENVMARLGLDELGEENLFEEINQGLENASSLLEAISGDH